jgi:putative endonuclease
MKFSYVYILFNKRNGTLYVGVTTDLIKRVWQHKNKVGCAFTKKYGVDKLGYYETFGDVELAIQREKRLKKFYRRDKLALIETKNPNWEDLYFEMTGSPKQSFEDDE